ncbi:hypothetical protein GKZ90_0009380 [Flavobacterium sp. MC2016-06]|uniref:hypothetical protein n=1 Tax=Flavobacterium sp. MC2016-06 TaxID=2676308 RepID=UPI0018ACC261|nr:hypothetical protein [Flavobacterium sp. MC2016-06]MBU3859323.1 hypothetical protein [Flavobacterium sp. MC2016-06]
MKPKLMYIENKNPGHNGEAWICFIEFSKSGQTIYFDNKALKKLKTSGINSNHYDIETGQEYWISGVKKDGNDRHKFGRGIIKIDKNAIAEYLKIINQIDLPKNKFEIVELDNFPNKERITEIENEKLETAFDYDTKYKNPSDLTVSEIEALILYYEDSDPSEMFKKGRKYYFETIENLQTELEKRLLKTV